MSNNHQRSKVIWKKEHSLISRPQTRGVGIKNSEYDQEIPQSQTADKPMAPPKLELT